MNLYDLNATNINGKEISLKQYTGNVVLIVNIATECGFSYQLEGFQKLFETYQAKGFTILAFPSNSFKKEPNDNPEIKDKCNALFHIKFPLFEKISVKGDDIHPLYEWLINQKGGFLTKTIKNNYTKFLIDREGNVIKRYAPITKPIAIKKDIEAIL